MCTWLFEWKNTRCVVYIYIVERDLLKLSFQLFKLIFFIIIFHVERQKRTTFTQLSKHQYRRKLLFLLLPILWIWLYFQDHRRNWNVAKEKHKTLQTVARWLIAIAEFEYFFIAQMFLYCLWFTRVSSGPVSWIFCYFVNGIIST